jgi:ATP-dependent RNA helicase DDX27
MVDSQNQTVGTLVQEFIRLRPGRETKRMGYLLYLCAKIYTDRVIVFFRQKKEAHRARVIFGLSGLKATELHGSMSQEQVRPSESLMNFVNIIAAYYKCRSV